MAPNYRSSNMSGVQISHANEYVIAPAVFPLTLPPASSRPFLGPGQCPRTGPSPAPPYTEHDPEVVGPNSMTPPPAYTESDLRVVIDDSKTHPHACHPPFHSLRNGLSPNPDDGGLSLDFGAPEETSSLQVSVVVFLCFTRYSSSIHTLTLAFRPKAV